MRSPINTERTRLGTIGVSPSGASNLGPGSGEGRHLQWAEEVEALNVFVKDGTTKSKAISLEEWNGVNYVRTHAKEWIF